ERLIVPPPPRRSRRRWPCDILFSPRRIVRPLLNDAKGSNKDRHLDWRSTADVDSRRRKSAVLSDLKFAFRNRDGGRQYENAARQFSDRGKNWSRRCAGNNL